MPLIFFTSTNFFCLDTVFCYPFLVRKYKKKDVQIEKTTIYTKNHWINETLDKNDEKYGKYYEKAQNITKAPIKIENIKFNGKSYKNGISFDIYDI